MNVEDFGIRIRKAREQLGLSQQQLGDLLGRDQVTISGYESGRTRVLAVDLPTLAEAFHVPILYFFDDHLSADDIDPVLAKELNKLPDMQYKRIALKLIRAVAEEATES